MGIFNRVLCHFSKEKPGDEVKTTNNRLLAQINHYASLIRLQDERQLVEVITANHEDSFQSMIIGVDLYNQQLIIDEFSPKLQNPQALIGQTVMLRHQHNRQMLKVSSAVQAWEEDTRCLLLTLPDTVNYQPRRHNYRVMLSGGRVAKATIDPIYGAPWYASISNISTGGMRILVTGDLRGSLHKNKPLRDCEITLDEDRVIHCRGKVKSFSYHGRPYRRTEISIAFEELTEAGQHILEEFIEHSSVVA